MIAAFIGVLFLQGVFILVDEIFFHRKRGLPPWEKWGHPLDTFFLIIPLVALSLNPSLEVYLGLAVFSCLFVTKDEWVHAQVCSGTENWLHAVLFVLHPIVFVCAWFVQFENSKLILWALPAPLAFMMYQIFYWNFYADRTIAIRQTTR